ncbi:PEFG-CTERM sorting domain-containing protein [Candidatus Nitrosotalea okcheonensis]|uniref:PEFG-CTERM sorting domain-containing protein n=1 Tax=Candidatus Nitrosotalea okcheonensis TaxID=1903276 RepID=UPI0013001098|nr:PEFG-CTERM sorting domain-containing protein [Candidatus Nitrosotalea okcheonensis]
MNKRLGGFVLFAIMISAVGIGPAFASPYAVQQNQVMANSTATSGNTTTTSSANTMTSSSSTNTMMSSSSSGAITVTTDKTSYNDGDKIAISGSTQDYITDTPITVIIISPIGNLVKVDQVNLGSDKTFSTSITATGALWQAAGAYTIKVQFGGPDRTAQTTFQFAGSAGGGPSGPTMKVDGTDFSVTYSITNGKVIGMKIDTNSKSLVVSIQTTGDGVLTMTLPRGLIDAKNGNTDAPFVVMNDGQESTFDQTSTTTTDRTLSIPFTSGTSQIEVVGTFAIPEFGTVAAAVLVIAIVSIIAISSKTELRFIPKY